MDTEEMKGPACMARSEKTVTLHAECYVKMMAEMGRIMAEHQRYKEALEQILIDYNKISYQTDAIIAMWSKAKRALDGVSAERQPGADGPDLEQRPHS